jgi:aspartate racemase
MATSGTIQSGSFQNAFRDTACELILPSEERQEDVMHLIYQNVKANRAIEMNRFEAVSRELKEKGAQVIILGCTELSVLHRQCELGSGYLDAMQLMAKYVVEKYGTLKEEYQELITGGNVL